MISEILQHITTFISNVNQEVIIGLMFIAALGYLVNVFWNRSRKPSHACGEGCNTCSAVDNIKKININ